MLTNTPRIASVLLLFVSLLLSSLSHAEMIKWTTKSVPNFEEVRDAAYGQGRYVAVGDQSTMLYSSDGINWRNGNLPPGLSCNLKTVAYAFGQFFAGGTRIAGGGGALLLSPDGVNWSDITDEFPSEGGLTSINELFTVSLGGQQTLLATVDIADMSHKGSVFASNDGTLWMPSYRYNSAHAGNFFQDGSSVFGLKIPDAWSGAYVNWGTLSWGASNINPSASVTSFSNVWSMPTALTRFAFGNATYVGVGSGRKLAHARSTSATFTYTTSPLISNYTGVAFGRDLFGAVGTAGAVVVSYDLGRSWRRASVSGLQSVRLNGVRYVGGRFITYGGGRIITGQPINKRNWSTARLPSGAKPVSSLASNGKTIVAVGKGGQILYSTTGASWSKAAPATSRDLYRVIYDKRTKAFYATGANGTLLRSSNGRRWQTIKTPGSGYYDGVARAGKALIAFGGTKGRFLQSSDGKRWTTGRETSLNFSGSVLGDGKAAYVFGPSGKLLIKRGNSKNWSVGKGASVSLSDLTIANKTIFATGANGRLFSTSQAKPGTWKSVDTRTSGALNGIAPNAGAAKQVAAVGQYGLVYSAPSRGKWRLEMLGKGAPDLQAVIKFKKRWLVAGGQGSRAFISHTQQN